MLQLKDCVKKTSSTRIARTPWRQLLVSKNGLKKTLVCRRFSIVSLGWLVLVFTDAVVAAQDGIAAAAGQFDVHVIVSEIIGLFN